MGDSCYKINCNFLIFVCVLLWKISYRWNHTSLSWNIYCCSVYLFPAIKKRRSVGNAMLPAQPVRLIIPVYVMMVRCPILWMCWAMTVIPPAGVNNSKRYGVCGKQKTRSYWTRICKMYYIAANLLRCLFILLRWTPGAMETATMLAPKRMLFWLMPGSPAGKPKCVWSVWDSQ